LVDLTGLGVYILSIILHSIFIHFRKWLYGTKLRTEKEKAEGKLLCSPKGEAYSRRFVRPSIHLVYCPANNFKTTMVAFK